MKAPGYSVILNKLMAKQRAAPRYIANFDSMAAMVRGIGRYLRGKDLPGMGIAIPANSTEPVGLLVNGLPRRAREFIYTYGGWGESIPSRKLHKVRAEAISKWIVSEYPNRQYPAVAVGSSTGALVHLCTALGIPWLPQTALIPVAHPNLHADEPIPAMEWAKEQAPALLEANPQLQLHHQWDPNQDRMMLERMTYFRVKQLQLGPTYEQFLKERLPEGGTIFLVECQRSYRTTKVDDRHIFQFGALGGATPDEFIHGSERVEAYLQRYGSHVRRWEAPEPDGDRPEAEWGFEPTLRADVERFAREHGFRVRRVIFQEPEHLSPLVADLHRWWYRQRQLPANRLIVESFILLEPYWTMRTGSVPFWMKFSMEPSLEWIENYLDNTEPYDEIYLMLFSMGVECVGLPSIDRWREVLKRAQKRGDFLGVDERRFPLDFATFVRYYTQLKRKVAARYPLPGPLALEQLDQFLEQFGDRYPVEWVDHVPANGQGDGQVS
jgi:hypothetical protein